MSVNEPIEQLTLTPGDVLVLRFEAGNQNQYSHAVDAAKQIQEQLKERGLNNLVLVTTGSMGVGVDSEERMRDLNRAEQRAATAEAAALRLQERVAVLQKQNAELVGVSGLHTSRANLTLQEQVKANDYVLNLDVRVARLKQEIQALRSQNAELEQKNTRTYCSYCGFEVAVDADASVISEHIRTCPKHPIADYREENRVLRERNAELVAVSGMSASTADLVERNRVLRGQIDVMTRTFIPREQVVAMMKWMREWCAELVDGWTGRRLAAAAAIRALPLPGEPQSFQHGRSGTSRAAKMFFIDEEATLPGDTYDVMKNVPMHANIDASISIIAGLQPDGRLVAREDRDGCCIDGGRLEGVGIALHGDNADAPAIVQAPQ